MAVVWPVKDASETLEYKINWADRLDGDTIATSTWALTVAAGLNKQSEANTSTETLVWLSAGNPGEAATLTNTITTALGRTMVEVASLPIDPDLVVETGVGLVNADTYQSIESIEAYCASRGIALSGTRMAKKQAARRAAVFLDTNYTYKGVRQHGREQALMWPRALMEDIEGWYIQPDEIPRELLHAHAEVTAYELANPFALSPTVTLTERVRRERIEGGVDVEYAMMGPTPDYNRPILTIVNDLLTGLLLDSADAGSAIFGPVSRA